jgi:hypothetical protein
MPAIVPTRCASSCKRFIDASARTIYLSLYIWALRFTWKNFLMDVASCNGGSARRSTRMQITVFPCTTGTRNAHVTETCKDSLHASTHRNALSINLAIDGYLHVGLGSKASSHRNCHLHRNDGQSFLNGLQSILDLHRIKGF